MGITQHTITNNFAADKHWPHFHSLFECIVTALQGPIETAVNLMLTLPALIQDKRALTSVPSLARAMKT